MKYKLFSKRGLALIVSLMMCLSAMSTTAWAGNFKDLQDLINNAGEDGKVVLDQNYTYGETAGVENENTHISITDKIDLNLNGWTITGSGNDSVIKVENGGDLTLRDEKAETPEPAETTETDSDEDAAEPEKVGTITNGGGNNGAGILVNGGSLTMEGGSITGNTAVNTGGGVYVTGGGSFTMDGGEISSNTTKNKNGNNGNTGGAGVFVDNGTVIMENGAIKNNTSAASGGGVYVTGNNSSFTMNGGEISTNKAKNDGEGGGIYGKNNAGITMNGGKITENTANSSWGGGGVRVYDGSNFTMNGGEITGNTAANVGSNSDRISVSDAVGDNKPGQATIKGGTIDSNAESHVALGHGVLVNDGGNTETVLKHDLNTPQGPHHSETVTTPATCTEKGIRTFQCSIKGCNLNHTEEIVVDHNNHSNVVTDEAVPATCTAEGKTEGKHCSECKEVIIAQKTIPTLEHTWDAGVVTTEPTTTSPGVKTFTCTRESCGATRTEEIPALEPTEPSAPSEPTEPDDGNTPDIPVLPETPELPDDGPDVPDGVVTIPDEDVPLGGEPAAAPVTIADEAVPLAGLLSLAQLLDELYRHEDRPAVDLPEGFPFASHEYAPAICWALDNALVVNTEAEPLDPDELLTVGLLRKVLTNYALLKGQEDFVVELTGEDDDLVLDLGERLTVFYAQLEAAE